MQVIKSNEETPVKVLRFNPEETLFFDIRTGYKTINDQGERKMVLNGVFIDYQKFLTLLIHLGFRRMDIDKYNSVFILIKEGKIIKEVDRKHITDSLIDYIKIYFQEFNQELGGLTIDVNFFLNQLFQRLNKLFDVNLLNRLNSENSIEFNKDQVNIKYIYFKNGFFKIQKVLKKNNTGQLFEDIETNFLDYASLPGYIWEDEIIQRIFNPKLTDYRGIFNEFFNLVCGSKTPEILAWQNRRTSLMTITGYLCHSFYDRKLKLVEFTDSRLSNTDEANGRSGKSLLAKAIGAFISGNTKGSVYCEINGKTFDTSNSRRFQEASLGTKLVNINDAKRDLTLEELYSDITEGLTIEKKNQHPFKISAKILITKNKPLKTLGDSDKDRVIEYEFSSYFSALRSPEKEFNLWLFRDFDLEEWQKFDLFMIECIKLFLLKDVIKPEPLTINSKKIDDMCGKDFGEWLKNSNSIANISTIPEILKSDLYNEFINEMPDYSKLKRNTFTRWIKFYFENTDEKTHQGIIVTDKKTSTGWVFHFELKK